MGVCAGAAVETSLVVGASVSKSTILVVSASVVSVAATAVTAAVEGSVMIVAALHSNATMQEMMRTAILSNVAAILTFLTES